MGWDGIGSRRFGAAFEGNDALDSSSFQVTSFYRTSSTLVVRDGSCLLKYLHCTPAYTVPPCNLSNDPSAIVWDAFDDRLEG